MNANINGFCNSISKYIKSSHSNKSLDALKNEINEIFKEHGVNDSNFSLISLAIKDDNIEFSSTSCLKFTNNLADKIYKNEQKKIKQENNEQNENSKNKEDELKNNKDNQNTKKNKSRPMLSFNLAELGDNEPSVIKEYFKRKFLAAGYTNDDLNKPNSNIKALDFNDKGMDLNVDPNQGVLDQFVEIIKKMYMIMINGESLDAVRNSTNFLHTKETETTFNLDLPGTEHDMQGTLNTYTPDVKVDFYKNNLDIDNNTDNKLTPEAEENKALYGLEVNTMDEYEAVMKELEETGVLEAYSLSKNDDSED